PVVFAVAVDPIEVGLVASLNRPGGNLTGVTNLNAEVGPKRLELLHELLPAAKRIAVLLDPTSPTLAEAFMRDLEPATSSLALRLNGLDATSDGDLDQPFATLVQKRPDALVIGPGAFFATRGDRLGVLPLRNSLPAVFQYRPFAMGGGLLSYGSN